MKPQTLRATAMWLLRRGTAAEAKKSRFAQAGVEVPKQTRRRITGIQLLRPFLAKANFVDPVRNRDCRQKNDKREQRQGPGRFCKERGSDAKDVGGDFGEAAVLAANAAATGAKTGEEFFDAASAGNFGVGAGEAGERVRIAAGNGNFAIGDCETFGFDVGAVAHLAVARFEGESVRREPFEVL